MNNTYTKPLVYRVRRKMQVLAAKIMGHKFMSKVYFRIVLGQKLDLKDPKTFNEKIQWLKLYEFPKDELAIKCADKYLVREYVEEQGLGYTLNGLVGVWDKASDIDWDKLPQKFALKCNHGCAYNIICDDKASFDTKAATRQLDIWMKEDFSLFNGEIHYSKIPRKIICEEYLENKDGFFPRDYKFFCFHGEPKFVAVFLEREAGLKRAFLSLDWKPLGYTKQDGDYVPEKPQNYDELLEIAKKLCKDFTFARVDVYSLEDRAVFGEITLTPTGGLADFLTYEADVEIGKLLHLKKD